MRGRPPLDLTGQTFGRLTALRPVGRAHGRVLWECRCSCGVTTRKSSDGLRQGTVLSCGCHRLEVLARARAERRTGANYFKLRAAGWSLTRIADKFGVTHQAVSSALKKYRPPDAGTDVAKPAATESDL
jgi:hypothetical protein